MSLRVVTPPATEPLTIAEVEAHCRIDSSNKELPPGALTCALAGSAGNVDNGAHRYACTFVTADGETEGGTVSSAVTIADKTVNGQVALSAIPLGGAAVTSRKLYRTAAGGSTYLLLMTIANNTATTYTDNTADSSLGVGMPTTNTTADPLLTRWARSAREMCEEVLRRPLITQTWKLTLDQFPGWADAISIPLPPLQSITTIKYYDTAGVLQTMDAADYIVDAQSEPARVTPTIDDSWPQTQERVGAVEIVFVAGYGAASDVPRRFKEWMLMQVGAMHENRAKEMTGNGLARVELGFVDSMIAGDRVVML